MYSTDLLQNLLLSIARLEFEARKDVVQIFNNLLRRQIGSRFPTVEYLCNKPDVLFTAFKGYEIEEVALNTGMGVLVVSAASALRGRLAGKTHVVRRLRQGSGAILGGLGVSLLLTRRPA